MAQTWDYAELSKLAKQNGGPEKLVEKFIRTGRWQMIPFIGIAFAGGLVAQKVIAYLTDKRKISKKELENAKMELVQGIKDYDSKKLKDQQKGE